MNKISVLRRHIAATMGMSGIGFVLSFASQMVISYHFGTSAELDAYWVAFALMSLLAFPLTPLRDALVPEFHRRLGENARAASTYFSQAMTLIFVVALVAALLGLWFADPLVGFAVNDRQLFVRKLAVAQLHWLAPAVMLLALSETLNAITLSYNLVLMQSAARLLGLLSTLAVLLACSGVLGTNALPMSTIAGQLMVALVQLIVLSREGLQFRWTWPRDLGDRFVAVSGALLVTYVASNLYMLFEKHVLTSFKVGLVSSFQYSASLTNVLITLGGISISNVLWPRFMGHVANKDYASLHQEARQILRLTFLLMGGVCAAVFVNANELVELIYARGAFDSSAVLRTADTLRISIFAAVPISVGLLMGRALVSLGAARGVMTVGLATTLTGCVVLTLGWYADSPGVAMSHWALANLVGMFFYIQLLAKSCGVRVSVLRVEFWWLARWLLALTISMLLATRFAFDGAIAYALFLNIWAKTSALGLSYAALAWLTGIVAGLPRLRRA